MFAEQPFLAECLALALERESDFTVVPLDRAGSGGVDASRAPEVVLAVCLSRQSAVRAVESLSDQRVVVVADTEDVALMRELLEMGVAGIVDATDGMASLLAAVRSARTGNSAVPSRVLSGIMRSGRTSSAGPEHEDVATGRLTERELEILALLADGYSTADIVAQLYLSTNTVRSYVQSVLRKLHSHSRLEAVVKARRIGLIDSDERD